MKKTVFEETGLKEYNRKRNFRQTAEPRPRVNSSRKTAKQWLFVIQKHDATRLHYDFRLEIEGVLKSWAVPKGPPTAHGEKHLAVQVEDHPFDYARFEGTIPEGNYGAGSVMVWDIGTYSVSGDDPIAAWNEGKLHITLHGKKLNGEWTLVRMKPRSGDDKVNWLFFKSGEDTKPISKKKDDESALTGRAMAQIAGQNKAQWQSHKKVASSSAVPPRIVAAIEKRKRSVQTPASASSITPPGNLPPLKLKFVEPMKARLVETVPAADDEWIYEIKFDGFRSLALKNGDEVQLLSRNQKSFNNRFPEIAEAVKKLPCSTAIFDGEIVALDAEGRSSFQLIKTAEMPGPRVPLCYYIFDLIGLDGKDLRRLPLRERKKILQSLITEEHEPIRFSASIHGAPEKLLEEVRKRGLEGIIAKNLNSEYESGQRTACWQKIKVVNEQEFVIGGYTDPRGSRSFFGAILIGYYKGKKFIFASKVGSGFDHKLLKSMSEKFRKLSLPTCPFDNLPQDLSNTGRGLTRSEFKKCHWIEPKLVCEIRFTEWTQDNHLRHPVFLGLREDKNPTEVIREEPVK